MKFEIGYTVNNKYSEDTYYNSFLIDELLNETLIKEKIDNIHEEIIEKIKEVQKEKKELKKIKKEKLKNRELKELKRLKKKYENK